MKKRNDKIKMGVLSVLAFVATGLVALTVPMGSVFAESKCPADMSPAQCAQQGLTTSQPEGAETDLTDTIKLIINTVIFVVGIVAVVMVILGGIQYSTSQGDAGKVKKAKDTIMYGIIGLVVALLAFAIVNFVLANVFNTTT